ncbi:MAG: Mitochondrial import inner membrane translocase subunit tim8 [Cirrosporium novae-zelandiae]|nr:MAG: Mitochondrial import inner membrane translocase subunit tim8 [Cirrosporium novae-zelandiae]
MDMSGPPADSNNNVINKLTPADRQELQQFLQNEGQAAKVQQTIHSLTDMCWNKCITGNINGQMLSGSEETCLRNCVERFIDGANVIVGHVTRMQQQQQLQQQQGGF